MWNSYLAGQVELWLSYGLSRNSELENSPVQNIPGVSG